MKKGQSMTSEQKEQFLRKRRATLTERYGNPNYNNMEKNLQTKLERYGDQNYNNQKKHKQTCIEKYGVEHHNQNKIIADKISKSKSDPTTQAKFEKTMLEKYGNSNPNLVPEIRQKYTNTLLKNYGVTNPLKNKDIWKKHLDTMKRNGSFNKSQPEEEYYQILLKSYSSDDIIRQYDKDLRYPYQCDFYIKSEDKFIELNIHPSHGDHPFNPDDEMDQQLLEQLRSDNTDWSNMIIDVWSNRDYIKRQTAIKNNLNYQVIYSL